MALSGVRVLELVGLAPGPFCGKILADFGATVTRVDRIYNNELDVLKHGKRTLALNLKNSKGQLLLRRLSKQYDVLIEPFRPGVMEKLNLGPDKLCSHNPRLIYARLTGFGQYGRLAPRAGHDINYAAISGVLSMLGRRNEKPTPPINLLADFAGGGLMCALGICLALLERHRSGCGQVVDAAMVEGAAYAASWLMMSQQLPLWGRERGRNALDGGVFFYDTYETKDGRFMSVGALEPQFFALLKEKLELPQLTQFAMDDEDHEAMTELMRSKFLEKTQFEWTQIFEDIDACVYPVLELHEAAMHEHNKERQSFQLIDGVVIPTPAPRLSRTPGVVATAKNKKQEEERNGAMDTKNSRNPLDEALVILKDLKLTSTELQELINDDVILVPKEQAKL